MVLQRFFALSNSDMDTVVNSVLGNSPDWKSVFHYNNSWLLIQKGSQKALLLGKLVGKDFGKWPEFNCFFGYSGNGKNFLRQPEYGIFINFEYLAEKTDIDGTYKYLLAPVSEEDIPNIRFMDNNEVSKIIIPKISTVIQRVLKEISKLPEPMICGKCFVPCCIRKSDIGKKFFACGRYPECKFTMSFGEGAKTLYADYLLPKNNQK